MATALLFDELLDGLRREGFAVGTDQYLRMHAVFERHANASPQELKTLLCPLFAMSAAEQERFHVAYDEFFASQAVPRQTFARKVTVIGQRVPESAKPQPAVRWRVIVPIVVIISTIVLWIAFGGHTDQQTPQPNETTVTATATAEPAPQQAPEPPARHPLGPWLISFALALFGAEVARTLLRWLRQREHRAQGRPFDWPVRDPHPTAPRLFADHRFYAAARLMKGREVGEVRRIDIPRSIVATIRALGDPTFEYKLDRRASEYLFLVERRSERDHLAAYVQTMIEALIRDGVLIEVFEYDGDPRHCWKPGTNTRIATADLYSRFPQHRLVIVGNAVALTNPVTGEALESIPRLFPWNCRAILTPEDETHGANRFGEYFDVYALASNGLARLAEQWVQTDGPPPRRRSQERRRNLSNLPSTPDELERELEPLLFRWLLRCSVHPTLHWDMTRELAPPLPANEHDAALLDLVRLEWFRQGRIPEAERLALVARLAEDESEEAAARTSATRVLAAAPPPPPGSTASRAFEIQQLAHKIWTARDNRAELRPLMRKLRQYPPSQVARDTALMMLLEEAPGTLVTRNMPQKLRRFLFRGGIPAFGMKNFVAIAAVLPVMAFALQLPKADPAPPPATETPVVRVTYEPPAPSPKSDTVASPAPEPQQDPLPAPVIVVATTETTDTQPPPVIIETKLETPKPPVLAELPTLIAPDGTSITIDDLKDAVVFSWKPAGAYTLYVTDSQGTPVHVAKVRGTSASWRPKSASAENSWYLATADGRTTEPLQFEVAYEVHFTASTPIRTERTVDVTLPVTCGTTDGKRDVNLYLSPRETFETADFKVLNADAFTAADIKPYDGASFIYRFVAKQPCRENTLEAKIRVTAIVRLTPAAKF